MIAAPKRHTKYKRPRQTINHVYNTQYDTVDHTLMLQILEKYGAPPKLCSYITRMYQELKFVLNIGKIKETMSQNVGVRQGDCMAPLLFLFMVMDFSETLEKEWTEAGLA